MYQIYMYLGNEKNNNERLQIKISNFCVRNVDIEHPMYVSSSTSWNGFNTLSDCRNQHIWDKSSRAWLGCMWQQKLLVSTYQNSHIGFYIMYFVKSSDSLYKLVYFYIYLYLTSSSHSSLMGIFMVVNRTTELLRCMLTLCWTILYCNIAFNHVKIT